MSHCHIILTLLLLCLTLLLQKSLSQEDEVGNNFVCFRNVPQVLFPNISTTQLALIRISIPFSGLFKEIFTQDSLRKRCLAMSTIPKLSCHQAYLPQSSRTPLPTLSP